MRYTFLVIGLFFFLGAIGTNIIKPVKSKEQVKRITVTNQDHDTKLRLQVGDELTVRLEVIPGTGAYTLTILTASG